MQLKKISILSALIACVLFAPQLEADAKGYKRQETDCGPSAAPMRVAARHIEPNGIGYNQGYTTAEGFFSLYDGWDQWVPFLDARLHIFNNGDPALNAGLGARYITDSRIWGINCYYDYRKTDHYHYNQVTAGLESLGQVWDFRVNGYAPVGRWTSHYYDKGFAYFQGNYAILNQQYEYALGGFNAEAAAHVDTWENFPLYFAAGPYYLVGRGAATWGGQARATVTIYDYLKIDGNVSYDHLFKWIGQGQVGLTFSFGKRKEVNTKTENCSASLALSTRAYQSVDRFEIIPVDRKHRHSPAINPATGDPYFFTFVDNLSSSLGTYESPYATLATAETNSAPYGIIYIFPGDGTTTGMDAGVSLQPNQKLWGSGVSQSLLTTIGAIAIPAQSNSILNGVVISPSIANATGNVVTASSSNEISGLFLQSQSTHSCILASDVANLSVLNSTLAGANAASEYGITASGLAGTLTVSNCILNQSVNNLLITNTEGSLNVIVSNSTIDNSSTTTTPAIGWTLSNAAQGALTIQNSSIASAYDAVDITLSDTSTITTTVASSQVTSYGNGFYLNSSSGSTGINLAFQNNTITSYYVPVNIVQTGTLYGTFTGNTIDSPDDYAFQLAMSTGSTEATLVMSQNSWTTNEEYCIYIDQAAGNLTATLTDNIITSTEDEYTIYILENTSAESQTLNLYGNTISGYYGLYLDSAVGSQTLNIVGNTITAYYYSIYYDQTGTNSVTATINDNALYSLYDEYCIEWSASGTGNSQLTATGNSFLGEYGFYLEHDNTGTSSITLNDNTGACEYPVYLEISDGTTDFSMTGNNFSGYEPVYIDQSGGTATISITDNTLYASASYGINDTVSAGTSTLTVSGNTITSSGTTDVSAIILDYAMGATASATISNNSLNCPTGAIIGDFGAGTYDVTLSNNTITTGGGVSLTAASASDATFYVIGNQFSALNTHPVAVTATGAGTDVCLQLNDNTAYPTADAYMLTRTSPATFNLNPPVGNIGAVVTSGTVNTTPCP